MKVLVVCQNYDDDRIIPRMARALRDHNGWSLSQVPEPGADAVYLSAYFEAQRARFDVPVAAYFTHREEEPPGNAKQRLFDSRAAELDLRVATCALYAEMLAQHGPTVVAAAPLEREHFTIGDGRHGRRPVVGFSGFTYLNHRKGEDLVGGILRSGVAKRCDFRASGRGWPVETRGYTWAEMPSFYRGLDVLVVPSRVEGIPMPPLEALACGVSVVVPRGVGLLDELPDLAGIWRYDKGDLGTLLEALGRAVDEVGQVDPEALRAATEAYSVENWCRDLREGVEGMMARQSGRKTRVSLSAGPSPLGQREHGTRGIYCVAFGEPSRDCARRLISSVKRHMPDVPVCLCAAAPGLGEDVFVEQPDSDIGGRRAKLLAYELAPAEWQSVLYLDADTEVVAPIYAYFEWVESGWELVICRDVNTNQLLRNIEAKVGRDECQATLAATGTWQVLQYNGGAWCFRRCEAVQRFFDTWRSEWERWAARDQASLVRTLQMVPLRLLVLGSEWNTFPKFQPEQQTAGLLHWPGDARRWVGRLPGRLDDETAWTAVREFEARQR